MPAGRRERPHSGGRSSRRCRMSGRCRLHVAPPGGTESTLARGLRPPKLGAGRAGRADPPTVGDGEDAGRVGATDLVTCPTARRAGGSPRGAVAIGVVAALLVVAGGIAVALRPGPGTTPPWPRWSVEHDDQRRRRRPPRRRRPLARRPGPATLAFGGDVLIHSGVWQAAATGAGYDFSPMLAPDRAAAHGRRPGDLPPRGDAGPARRRPLQLPALPCADRAGHRPRRGRLRRVLGRLEPRPRLRRAGRGGHARRARRGGPGPRRHGPLPGGGRARPAVYDVDGIAVAHLSYAYGFNGFVRPVGQGVAGRPDRPGPDRRRRPGRPGGGRRAGGRVACTGATSTTTRWSTAQQTVADALGGRPRRRRPRRRSPRPRRAADLQGRARCGWCGAWATSCRTTPRGAARPRPLTA